MSEQLVTRENASTLVKASFPTVDAAGLRYLGSGTLYDVFGTADGWAFRFPRMHWSGDLFEPEAIVHKVVAPRIPPRIRLPRVELRAPPSAQFPYPIAGHRFISGVSADELDEKLMPAFASEIATFLGALHSTPTPAARAEGMHEFIMDDGRQPWFDNAVRILRTLRGLDPVLDRALDWFGTEPWKTYHYDGPLHPIHGGLDESHILVDPSTGFIEGVIDWSDSHLGDAARDFVFLVTWKGWPFVDEVLDLYPRAIDGEFRARLRYMAQWLSPIWLAYAHAENREVAKHIRYVHNAFAEATGAHLT